MPVIILAVTMTMSVDVVPMRMRMTVGMRMARHTDIPAGAGQREHAEQDKHASDRELHRQTKPWSVSQPRKG